MKKSVGFRKKNLKKYKKIFKNIKLTNEGFLIIKISIIIFLLLIIMIAIQEIFESDVPRILFYLPYTLLLKIVPEILQTRINAIVMSFLCWIGLAILILWLIKNYEE